MISIAYSFINKNIKKHKIYEKILRSINSPFSICL